MEVDRLLVWLIIGDDFERFSDIDIWVFLCLIADKNQLIKDWTTLAGSGT